MFLLYLTHRYEVMGSHTVSEEEAKDILHIL